MVLALCWSDLVLVGSRRPRPQPPLRTTSAVAVGVTHALNAPPSSELVGARVTTVARRSGSNLARHKLPAHPLRAIRAASYELRLRASRRCQERVASLLLGRCRDRR